MHTDATSILNKIFKKKCLKPDMNNFKKFTPAGFLISRIYLKVLNYANFKIATKQRNDSVITLYTTMTSFKNALPRASNLTQAR